MQKYSDEDIGLVKGIIDGEENAFKSVYYKYHSNLYYYTLKFVKSDELAKEIVHDVFLKIWENRTGLNKQLSFKGYLLKICKNHILNILKRASREVSIKKEILRSSGFSHDETENAIYYSDYRKFALQAIAQLPPQRQIIFKMSKIEGRSHEEIAENLGISKGTVRDHLLKASRYVKKYLSAHADLTFDLACMAILMVYRL